ncbi:hypothetical protein GLOIN_2v1787271 [Rhizophagus irregularis DAOM 181602=DAOM 197198]|nr:hypothetical protein GLOIN_2v1787271 [Rhizophagus irregularis DAOM 181602=DAOM 197198]
MAGTTIRVPIAETTFSNRVFIHDYPRSSKIEAHFQSNERLYISYYNIISLGTYPSTPKLTQKSKNNASQYPIPDDYIIGHAEWSVSSTQSSTAVVNTFLQKINLKSSTKSSGPRLFGFDIEPLYHAPYWIRLQRESSLHQLQNSNSMTIQTKLDAIVRVCDEALLSRDGYRHLAAVVPSLFQDIDQFNGDNNSDKRASDTLVNNYEVGNGAYCSLSTLLKILIPVWKGRENPVIIPGDILHIKLGGDGRNVRRKQNHVIVTFCLLNEKDDVLKPNHQYSICLYIGKEKYETLDKVGKIFALQLADLKENGIIDDDGIHWPVEFYFSGDWKEKRASLFPVIDLLNYIPDELHILLRISDILMECLFRDLFKKNDFERNFKEKIEKKMNNINIHFEFYRSSAQGTWNWTSLMGPEKKKMLQYFPVSEFIPGVRGVDIENLWRKFYQLYEVLRKPSHTEAEILKFEEDAKNWVRTFCRPTIGQMNSATAIPGLYRKDDVTPYMHMLTMHVPYFMRRLKEKGLSLRLFSTSSVEKKNHDQVRLFFGGTTMGGGKKKLPVVYDILVFENRQIFYLINNIPNEITCRNINIYNGENTI